MNKPDGGEAMGDPVVSLRGTTKYYGRKCAVFETDLDLHEGRIYGLIGVNGAGKTTTLKMILGLAEPTRGTVTTLGHDPLSMPPEVRGRIGYVAERHPLYREMTVARLAEYQRSFFHATWSQEIFDSLAYSFGISPGDVVKEISNGQRAHVYLAMVMAQRPDLLIMDDPTLGLDPLVRRQFLETVTQVMRQSKRTTIFSSHIIDDIERIADHIFIMSGGHLAASCSIATFKERVRRVSMRFEAGIPSFKTVENVRWVREDGRMATLTVLNCDDAFKSRLAAMGATEIAEVAASLEDLFIDFTRESYVQVRLPEAKP